MKVLIKLGQDLCIMVIFTLFAQGCFELGGSDDGLPCGDQLACPRPKQCVNEVCISECLEDDECETGQVCESLRCVPRYQEEVQGGASGIASGGQLNHEGGQSDHSTP